MTAACHLAVRMATGQVFTDQEIDDQLARLVDKANRARKANPSIEARAAIRQAAADLTHEQLFQALAEKRYAVAAKIAETARRAQLDGMGDLAEAKKLDALNVGTERQVLGGSSSVDADAIARQMTLWGKVKIGLKQKPGLIDRISNPWGVSERGMDRKIAAEMARLNGDGAVEPTGDEGALHAARVFTSAIEDARSMQNDKGAWIQRLPGYIARQSHDAGKIAGGLWGELGEFGRRVQAGGVKGADWTGARLAASRRAFGEWRDFIMPRLDDRTFEGLDNRDMDDAAIPNGALKDPTDLKERMLYTVWSDIVTGRHATISGADDEGDFKRGTALARAVSRERVLHFKTPDSWVDYNSKYGRSSLFASVMGQLERAGRNTALMAKWGPDPETAFAAEKTRLGAQARARGDVKAGKDLDSYMTQARFEAINGRGETPENMRIAQTMRTIRGWEALTKLGSIVLSKSTDLPLSGHTMARAGAGFLAGYKGFFDGVLRLGSADAKRAADSLDVGARSFAGHLGGQFVASDGAPGWTSWATRLMYKVNAFEWFNNGVRSGAAEVYSRHLGQESDKAFADLHPGTRETMERFGIQPEDWDKARAGLEAASDGRTYFTLEHLDADPDTALKFRAMIHNVLDDAVSEPRARERAGITRGTKAGTLQGELFRAFFQFKGFINTIVGRHLVPTLGGYAGYKPAALIAHLVIGTGLAGYISMNAKLIARGQQPKGPVGEDLSDTVKTWAAALTQGGGLGIYGDFLFGELNRQGHDFNLTELGGPLLSDGQQVAKVVRQAISGGEINESTGRSQIPAELVRLGGSNIPLVNLWYTRLAIDYAILWRLQEAASPGYLQRYQDRVETKEHSKFILSPTSAQ